MPTPSGAATERQKVAEIRKIWNEGAGINPRSPTDKEREAMGLFEYNACEHVEFLLAAYDANQADQVELLDAIEGLLITFVYDNPLPPDIAATTKDAHVAVAEELLLHHGRQAFVESRVDRVDANCAQLAALREALEAVTRELDEMMCVMSRSIDQCHGNYQARCGPSIKAIAAARAALTQEKQ